MNKMFSTEQALLLIGILILFFGVGCVFWTLNQEKDRLCNIETLSPYAFETFAKSNQDNFRSVLESNVVIADKIAQIQKQNLDVIARISAMEEKIAKRGPLQVEVSYKQENMIKGSKIPKIKSEDLLKRSGIKK